MSEGMVSSLNWRTLSSGAGQFNSVDGRVVQPGFGAADLYVLAFALVALQADAGHAAHDIGDVLVRQAIDYAFRHHIQNIVGGALFVDGLRYALRIRDHGDFLVLGGDLHLGFDVARLASDDPDLLGENREADIGNGQRIVAGCDADEIELALRIGGSGDVSRLQFDAGAWQHRVLPVHRAAGDGAGFLLAHGGAFPEIARPPA